MPVTYWKCGRCGRIFKVNSKVKKYLNEVHEDPISPCGCKVTKFHYDNFIADSRKKTKQKKFSLVPGLADNPKFEFLNRPHNSVWKDRGDAEDEKN